MINALGGDDTIYGRGGDDVVCGGAGADVIGGGPGNDTLYGSNGPDRLTGGTGRDRLEGARAPTPATAGSLSAAACWACAWRKWPSCPAAGPPASSPLPPATTDCSWWTREA